MVYIILLDHIILLSYVFIQILQRTKVFAFSASLPYHNYIYESGQKLKLMVWF